MIHYHIIISKSLIKIVATCTSLLFFIFYASGLYAALSCTVTTTCASPSVVVFRMQSTANSQVQLASQTDYTQLVCCSGGTGLATSSCSGIFTTVAKISATTNAHIEQGDQSNYANNACMSVTSGTISVGYQDTNCTGYDTTIASISGATNAHAGSSGTYTRKICGSVGEAASLTFSVDSGGQSLPTISPGTLVATSSILTVKTTNSTGFSITANRSNALATMLLNTDNTVTIPDKTVWSAPGATTTAGNATASTTEPLTLQFRISQNLTDVQNYASVWWGVNDTTASALFAGFPTTAQTIINSSISAPATTTAYALYNLNVPTTQKNGVYSGDIVYSATANP